MANKERIQSSAEAWESGSLGRSMAHARRAPEEMERNIDDALGLQAISIRIPKAVIETYKMLAKIHGVGYQPLMRDALCRFAEAEMKQLLVAAVEVQRQAESAEGSAAESEPAPAAKRGPLKKAA